MITLEDAREQLLSQIELKLCRIYEGGVLEIFLINNLNPTINLHHI